MFLTIVRHGIAIDREDPACPAEADRYLTDRGIRRTHKAAQGLFKLGVQPDLILSSPWTRAYQTAEIVAEHTGYPIKKIKTTKSLLWDADPEKLFDELSKLNVLEVVACGHAPHVDEAVAYGIGATDTAFTMKKAGAARLEISPGKPPMGRLLWLMTPKVLRALAD